MRRRLVPALITSLALLGACSTETPPAGKDQKSLGEPEAGKTQEVAKPTTAPSEPGLDLPPADPKLAPPSGDPVLDALREADPAAVEKKLAVESKAKFELLSNGDEPRQELRFSPTTGQSETMVLTMIMEFSLDVGEPTPTTTKTPPIKMFNTSTIGEVADGRIEQKVVFDRYEMGDDGSGNGAMMAAAMGQAFDQMKGFEQRMIYDTRGMIIEGDWTVPPGMDPQMAANLENVNQSLEQAMLRLPAEAVGVGAKWKEVSQIDSNGLKIEQSAEYTVDSIEGKTLSVSTDIVQTPTSKKLQAPNMPPGVEVDLLEFDSKGTGKVVIELDHMIPVSGSSVMDTNLTVEAGAAGQKQKVTTKIKMTMEIARLDNPSK